MRKRLSDSGFSAVELLVALFVAAAFIISGSQLYLAIIKSGSDANMLSKASAKLAEYLQIYRNTVPDPCVPSEPYSNSSTYNGSPISVAGLTNITLSIKITCPSTASHTSKITATLAYGSPQKIITDATYTQPGCPQGFISVPGSSTYGTNNFCVMKYEAKNDGSGNAVSTAAGSLYTNITQANASTAASAACTGCHLITEAEWLTIAQNVLNVASNWYTGPVGTGYIYSGHNDNAPASALAASTNDNDSYFGETNHGGNQDRTLTLSNGEVIWDFAGNVDEWTNGTITGAQLNVSGYAWREWTAVSNNGISPNPFPSFTGITGAGGWTGATNGIGKVNSNSSETVAKGFVRGGGFNDVASAGVMGLDLSNNPTATSASIGFRVTR